MCAVRVAVAIACLLVLAQARAQEHNAAVPAAAPKELRDLLYKGLAGKALDAVPMDPEHRVALQRTNAVVSNTFAGRSLSVWAGMANPVLLLGGLAWGIYSAINIKHTPAAPAPEKAHVTPAPAQLTATAAVDAEGP